MNIFRKVNLQNKEIKELSAKIKSLEQDFIVWDIEKECLNITTVTSYQILCTRTGKRLKIINAENCLYEILQYINGYRATKRINECFEKLIETLGELMKKR